MVNSKRHRKFDKWNDEDLKTTIEEKYGYFNQSQYEFSKRLNLKLVEANYTNIEFAELTEIHQVSISNYATGKRMPNSYELGKMANKLGVSTDYLLGNTDCITFSAQEINKIIGLSENAMKTFAMLYHNKEEIQDLMDPMQVSNVHKNKLKILSSFIEDLPNFSMFLTQIESYVRTKQEINKISNDKENILNYDKEKEDLEAHLIGIEGRIQKSILDSLNKVVNEG